MVCNSFDIICVCVCVLPCSRLNGQICGHDFWCVCQVEEYLSQVQRSRSLAKGQGQQVKNFFRGVFGLMELDELMGLHSDEDASSYLGEASQNKQPHEDFYTSILRNNNTLDTIYDWSGYDVECF